MDRSSWQKTSISLPMAVSRQSDDVRAWGKNSALTKSFSLLSLARRQEKSPETILLFLFSVIKLKKIFTQPYMSTQADDLNFAPKLAHSAVWGRQEYFQKTSHKIEKRKNRKKIFLDSYTRHDTHGSHHEDHVGLGDQDLIPSQPPPRLPRDPDAPALKIGLNNALKQACFLYRNFSAYVRNSINSSKANYKVHCRVIYLDFLRALREQDWLFVFFLLKTHFVSRRVSRKEIDRIDLFCFLLSVLCKNKTSLETADHAQKFKNSGTSVKFVPL